MKKISALLLLILASAFLCKGQERLEQALERYDYRRALEIIDSLAAEIGTDSTAMAGNREEVIDLAIQKSLCLRKLYRAEEAAEAESHETFDYKEEGQASTGLGALLKGLKFN